MWHVKLVNEEDHLVLKYGWNEFVEENYIEEGDMLSFEYVGYSSFNVLIYDKDCCEREVSYLARNNKNILADGSFELVQRKENVQKLPPADNCEVHSPKQLTLPGFPPSNVRTASNALGVETADRSGYVRKSDFCSRRRVASKTDIADHPIGSADNRHRHPSLNELESSDATQAQQQSSGSSPTSSGRSGSNSESDACADLVLLFFPVYKSLVTFILITLNFTSLFQINTCITIHEDLLISCFVQHWIVQYSIVSSHSHPNNICSVE